MRVRKKKWAQAELDRSTRLVSPHGANMGRWGEYFGNGNDIHAEIGCGKGRFITQSAALFPGINFVAVERAEQVIVSGMRSARERGEELSLGRGLAFVNCDAGEVMEVFAPGELSRIYINFCDPWPRPRWRKRRLTHAGYLEKYKALLKPGGGVFFKTDNLPLFEFSLGQFAGNGWRLESVTRDLHGGGPAGVIMTEYEEKFFKMGMPICRCEAYI